MEVKKRRKRVGKGSMGALTPLERRRLVQLGVCLALFLTVFGGYRVFPDKFEAVRIRLGELILRDADFAGAFHALGERLERKEPAGETLGKLWVEVMGGVVEPVASDTAAEGDFPAVTIAPTAAPSAAPSPSPAPTATPEPAPTPAPEAPLLPVMSNTGPALPATATYDFLPFGLEEQAAPVSGAVTSGYGWREHPIQGGEDFHQGVDLAAESGTEIGAFAAGTVAYTGEGPSYGKYVCVSHENGVTSFYAHCSEVTVRTGETLELGETVALVGQTGNATGPHLHFELRKDGVLVNPLYYIAP